MVDIVGDIDGVYGAQISGAGLGGCIMVLAAPEAQAEVERRLTEHYYAPRAITPLMFRCVPVGGSGLLSG